MKVKFFDRLAGCLLEWPSGDRAVFLRVDNRSDRMGAVLRWVRLVAVGGSVRVGDELICDAIILLDADILEEAPRAR